MRELKEGITGEGKDEDKDQAELHPAPSEPVVRPSAEPSSAERRDSAEVGSDPKA